MPRANSILLVAQDTNLRDRWEKAFASSAHFQVIGARPEDLDAEPPNIVVADQLPVTGCVGPWEATLSRGEIGVIGVGCTGAADVLLPDDHTPRELRLASQLLAQIVHLRARLTREKTSSRLLHRMANTDALTGLLNRRAWDELLARRFSEPMERGRGRCIALVDIDHFKKVNDRYGHAIGDAALREVGQMLSSGCRRGDILARLGGDEFALLLHDVEEQSIAAMIERVRQRVGRAHVASAADLTITASIGYTFLNSRNANAINSAVAVADAALRQAKDTGRDRSVEGELLKNAD